MKRISGWVALAMAALCAAPAAADDYALHTSLAVRRDLKDKYGKNLASLVDLSGSPVQTEATIMLYQGQLGEYPKAGIHMVEMDPGYMTRHFENMHKNLHRWVPEGYDGIVIIDYEAWWAAWEHTFNAPSSGAVDALDWDFQDDWRDFIERYRPDVISGKSGDELERALRDSYEEATLRFLVATIRECKRMRPDARWGFYNYPKMIYNTSWTPSGAIGYGDCTHYASEINDRIAPLFAEMDVTAPRIYPVRRTVDGAVSDPLAENTIAQQRQFLSSHVREAKRIAPHAMTMPLGATRYYGAQHPDVAGKVLTGRNTYLQYVVPREAGAEAMLIWGDATTDAGAHEVAAYMNDIAVPMANRLWELWHGEPYAEPPARSGESPSGGADAVAAPIPAALLIRYAHMREGDGDWGEIKQGKIRIHVPTHSPTATVSAPVHRGGRIVSRRATKKDE